MNKIFEGERMNNKSIGVFDSGLGGLTCVSELFKILPNESIVYFGDTGRVPYGSRSEEAIIRYVRGDISFLMSHDIKLIVAACGTASTVALPHLLDKYNVKIIGVVEPAVDAAVKATKSGRVGIIGTSQTIANGKYEKLLKEKDASIKTFSKACPIFVPLVENGLATHEITRLACEMYLKEIKEKEIDTLILGCTHYPMLKDVIAEFMGDGVTLIDPGKETAHYVRIFLSDNNMQTESIKKPDHKYFVSDTVDGFEKTAELFLGESISGKVFKTDIDKY